MLYIAPHEAWALALKEMLEQEGLLVMLRSGGVPHMGTAAPHEVLVPESEIDDAHEVLTEILARMPAAGARFREAGAHGDSEGAAADPVFGDDPASGDSDAADGDAACAPGSDGADAPEAGQAAPNGDVDRDRGR